MTAPLPQSALRYPLTDVLGSQAAVRCLRELVRHGGELSAASLAERGKIAVQNVRPALRRLAAAGVIDAIGSGGSRLYRIRCAHPLAGALDALFRAEEERFQAIIESVRAAVAEDGEVEAAWLYGSVARGEDTAASDLDVAVIAAESRLPAVLARLRERLDDEGERLAFRPSVVGLDAADLRRLGRGDPWWTTVAADALTLKGRPPAELVAGLVPGGRTRR